MSDVLSDAPSEPSPQEQEWQKMRMRLTNILHIAQKTLFVVSSLISSAHTLYTQLNVEPKQTITETTERTHRQRQYLQEWIQSTDGINMQLQLADAVDKLDDPSPPERQNATRTILESLKALQAMIHPFPKELDEILGKGLSDNNRDDEHARQDLLKKGFTWPQSAQLAAIQDKVRSENFHRIPRIMPGEYTIKELQEALEEQTGITFVMDGKITSEQIHIEENANTWIDAVSALKNIGGNFLHHQLENDTILINNYPDPYSETLLDKTYVFVHSEAEESGTFIAMVRTAGRLVRPIESRSPEKKFLLITFPERSNSALPSNLHKLICMNSDTKTTIADVGSTQMRALATDPPTQMAIPFGEQVALGRYQIMEVKKVKTVDNKHIVYIRIDDNPQLRIYRPLDGEGGIFNMVGKRNQYDFKNAQGDPIDATERDSGDIVWNSSWFAEFILNEDPAEVTVTFIPNVREVIIRPPLSCLPKDANQ